jgi:hypothetical protein
MSTCVHGPGRAGLFNRLKLTTVCRASRPPASGRDGEIFEEVDGFDERLAVEYNDVDFCIRLRQAGYKIIWTPFAELKHHERASRKNVRRLPAERAYMRERWGLGLDADPFYNPNLALDRKLFQLANEPRVHRPWPPGGAPTAALQADEHDPYR